VVTATASTSAGVTASRGSRPVAPSLRFTAATGAELTAALIVPPACKASSRRLADIVTKFEQQIDNEAKASFGVPHVGNLSGSLGSATGASTEVKTTQAERFQRIVNETQLARLNKMMEVLDEDILDSVQNYTYVLIDDLDQDWVDVKVANDLIRCLFRAVFDMRRIQNLKVLVALRTNIFEELDFGSRAGGQQEKFRGLTLTIRWTADELLGLLNRRVRAAAERHAMQGFNSIADLVPSYNKTRGSAVEYIMERTLMRPRDAISYLNNCIALASERTSLTWNIIHDAERSYSDNRLFALRDEWSSTYADIDKLFRKFRKAPVPMARDELTSRLDDAILLLAEKDFSGVRWMTDLSEPLWSGATQDWNEMYHPLFRLLFNLGFLGCRLSSSGAVEEFYNYDRPEFGESVSDLATVTEFFIHPAFRKALDVREPGRLGVRR
jgi:hypothetical protein